MNIMKFGFLCSEKFFPGLLMVILICNVIDNNKHKLLLSLCQKGRTRKKRSKREKIKNGNYFNIVR